MIRILIVIMSFFLDGITSNLLMFSNFLYPLFSLLSLVIIYPLYKKNEINKFYILALVIGLFYDVIYTNTLFLNMVLFFLAAILIKLLYNLLNNTIYNSILISVFLIICYRLFTYLCLLITESISLNVDILFSSIYSSLIINIIYIIVFYYFCIFISKKLHTYRKK